MNKILNDPTYRNNSGYNGNDMSSIQTFTSSVGHILPVTWDFLQPGDKIRVSDKIRTRTMPLVSAAFGEIEEHVRWFFVPMSQIYKPFGDLFHGIQDLPSDFYNTVITSQSTRLSNRIPQVPLKLIINTLLGRLTNDPSMAPSFFRSCRLLEMMGVPLKQILTTDFLTDETLGWRMHGINLLPFMAYQKIWFDYFRDTDRYPNDPTYYNYDTFCDVNNQPEAQLQNRIGKFLELQLCPMFKDSVNNLMVSPLFGESGVGGDSKTTLNQVKNWLVSTTVRPVDTGVQQSYTVPTSVTPNSTSPIGSLSTAALRSMFAVDKLLEITRRAKKHYDAQTLAHFGVVVPMGMDGECIEIGHHKSNIVIGDVLSTAATEEASLGEIAGKGYNSDQSGSNQFEAKTHGVLMCVYYARPKVQYDQLGIDKKLLYSYVYDFPREEFENLGMQPVFKYNQILGVNETDNVVVQGWQYRYQEVKSQVSRALTGMSRTLASWNIIRDMNYKDPISFYCQPWQINDIMDVKYSELFTQPLTLTPAQRAAGENENMYDTDPLVHQLLIDYRKASKLSTYGIAQL